MVCLDDNQKKKSIIIFHNFTTKKNAIEKNNPPSIHFPPIFSYVIKYFLLLQKKSQAKNTQNFSKQEKKQTHISLVVYKYIA